MTNQSEQKYEQQPISGTDLSNIDEYLSSPESYAEEYMWET